MIELSKQQKWDQRHDTAIKRLMEQSVESPKPCSLLRSMQSLLPKPGRGLELAAGLGGNSLFLASQGWQMEVWDFSGRALEYVKMKAESQQGEGAILSRCVDLETPSLGKELQGGDQQFDLIVVSYYLYRPLCAMIPQLLKPGGMLFYQTFHQRKDPNIGPGNLDFLLKPNELLALFPTLDVVFYWDGMGDYQCLELDEHSSCLVAKAPLVNNTD